MDDEDSDAQVSRVYKLELLKGKLVQLLDAINVILDVQEEHAWHQTLSQFNVLLAHYEGLFSLVSNFYEKQVTLPTDLPSIPQMVPEILLRTRPPPEVEEEEESLSKKCEDISIQDLRAYDSMIEYIYDMIRDDSEIRKTLKKRTSEPKDDQAEAERKARFEKIIKLTSGSAKGSAIPLLT